jgi:hypothetical protein
MPVPGNYVTLAVLCVGLVVAVCFFVRWYLARSSGDDNSHAHNTALPAVAFSAVPSVKQSGGGGAVLYLTRMAAGDETSDVLLPLLREAAASRFHLITTAQSTPGALDVENRKAIVLALQQSTAVVVTPQLARSTADQWPAAPTSMHLVLFVNTTPGNKKFGRSLLERCRAAVAPKENFHVLFLSKALQSSYALDADTFALQPRLADVQTWVPAREGGRARPYVTMIDLRHGQHALLVQLARALPGLKFLGVPAPGLPTPKGDAAGQSNLSYLSGSTSRLTVLAQSRLLLLANPMEVWGLRALEAMAAGVPVVASRSPGLDESCGKAATYVPTMDVAAWVKVVQNVLANAPLYASLQQAGIQHVGREDRNEEQALRWLRSHAHV